MGHVIATLDYQTKSSEKLDTDQIIDTRVLQHGLDETSAYVTP